MGEWKYLHVKAGWDKSRNADKVISVDEADLGREISSQLTNPTEPDLSEFLLEAGKQEWELVSSDKEKVILKRYFDR